LDVLFSISLGPTAASENERLVEAIGQIPLAWLLAEIDTSNPLAVLTAAEKVGETKSLPKDELGRVIMENLR